MSYVPRTAIAAGRADVKRIGGDASYGSFMPSSVGQSLAELGIPMTSVEFVVTFSDSLSGPDAAILSGPGLGSAWRTAARGDRWVSRAGVMSAALTADIVGIGTAAQVDALSATRRWSGGFTSRTEFKEIAEIFDRRDPMTAAVIWPSSVGDAANAFTAVAAGGLGMAGFGSLGGIVKQLGVGRAIAFGCLRQGSIMRVDAGVLMSSESTASIVAGGLSIAKGLGALVGKPPSGADIGQMDVQRRGAFLRVGLSVPINEWR